MRRFLKPATAVPGLMIVSALLIVGYANWRDRYQPPMTNLPPIGTPGGFQTSREDLERAGRELEAKLQTNPADAGAAIALADVLMRRARVVGDARLSVRAEEALKAVLRAYPADYEAQRMLGTVYLAQHRFQEAVDAASRARDLRPDDAWNYGVIGDGQLELGDYDRAFAAFDKMAEMRPSAAAYARVAYAHELQGRVGEAIRIMTMAAEATSAHDPESQAWHYAQIGNLYFQAGQLDAARREYERAKAIFPHHPYALSGIARVKAAAGDYRGALAIYESELARAGTPELAAQVGDLFALLGDHSTAERHYVLAEQLERDGWKAEQPQPGALARFLAERNRKLEEALTLAQEAAATRRDIYTYDALAWAQFKNGDARAASVSIDQALRTNTSDRKILYHAAAIKLAAGDRPAAAALARRSVDTLERFDLIAAPAARALANDLNRM